MTREDNSANVCLREPGPSQGAESWRTWTTWCRHESLLSFISSDVFEPRTSTGSGLFVHLSCDFEQTFGRIISIRVKTVSHTNLVASRHIKGETLGVNRSVYRLKSMAEISASGPARLLNAKHNDKFLILVSLCVKFPLPSNENISKKVQNNFCNYIFFFLKLTIYFSFHV